MPESISFIKLKLINSKHTNFGISTSSCFLKIRPASNTNWKEGVSDFPPKMSILCMLMAVRKLPTVISPVGLGHIAEDSEQKILKSEYSQVNVHQLYYKTYLHACKLSAVLWVALVLGRFWQWPRTHSYLHGDDIVPLLSSKLTV